MHAKKNTDISEFLAKGGKVKRAAEGESGKRQQEYLENEQHAERASETHGAYRAAGCTSEYWRDRDAGLAD